MRADPTYRSLSHQHHSYVARGRYAEQLRRWHGVIDPDRLLVLDSSAFFADPESGYREVLDFLGLPQHSLPSYRQLNAHSYGSMSDRARGFLQDRFREANRDSDVVPGSRVPLGNVSSSRASAGFRHTSGGVVGVAARADLAVRRPRRSAQPRRGHQ